MKQCSKLALGVKTQHDATRAFTLIELLVVIAIIAILAAIIFPAFSAAQENARENNTMAHLHDISEGLGLYKLDNKAYPPVLFGYACDATASAIDGCNVNDTMQSIAGDPKATNELVGLYPEYVKSWQDFETDGNTYNDSTGAEYTTGPAPGQPSGLQPTLPMANPPQPNYLCQDGSLQPGNSKGTTAITGGTCNTPFRSFFLKDSADIGPQIGGSHQLTGGADNPVYVIRYQLNWTSWNGNFDPAYAVGGSSSAYAAAGAPWWNNYPRQLGWQNPPADTYVTAITSHIPNSDKLIALYESGSAYKTDAPLGNPPSGFNDTTVAAGTGPSGASIVPVTDTSVDPKTHSACNTQPANGATVACNYVPAQFWAFNITGR